MKRALIAWIALIALNAPLWAQDTWTLTTTTGAPSSRYDVACVWTGSEVIIWGGDSTTAGGARYNPATDTWRSLSTTGAPAGRRVWGAVWSGSEMLVWGGAISGSPALNTGGRYNPTTDTWRPITTLDAPTARWGHTGIWTGTELIVWGGNALVGAGPQHVETNTGGRYNPATDVWAKISTTSAPAARRLHTAVWTGTQMIVWGGEAAGNLNTGGLYNPSGDTWLSTPILGAPTGASQHSAVWTGSQMIVWGGVTGAGASTNAGKLYHPIADRWTDVAAAGAPGPRHSFAAVWTGAEFIVWGGWDGTTYLNNGARFNPLTGTWNTLAAVALTGRYHVASTWIGNRNEMFVWGGAGNATNYNTGARYTPPTASAVTITPATGFTSSGPVGGPFTPASTSYTLTNAGATSVNWSITRSLPWVGLSASSGTLVAGGTTSVTVSILTAQAPTSPDTYTDTLSFIMDGATQTTRIVTLTVTGGSGVGSILVTPSTDLSSVGPPEGPFVPASIIYTVSNPGSTTVNWTATKTRPWVVLSTVGGTLSAGASTTLTASIDTPNAPSSPGAYADTISIANTTNGIGTTSRAVNLTISGSVSVAGTPGRKSSKGRCGSVGLDLLLPLLVLSKLMRRRRIKT